MKLYLAALCALLAGCTPQSLEPTAAAWTALFDGSSLDGWQSLGDSNWRVEDGSMVADTRSGPAPGYLVSAAPYKDFVLRVEFWASDDANSGVFIRCADPGKITDRNCYEANIFDQRPDPSYGTGAIVLHVEVDPMPKAGGQWNTYTITAKGRDITAVLNGKTTATLRSGLLQDGYIAVQHGSGTMKFRKIEIRPL